MQVYREITRSIYVYGASKTPISGACSRQKSSKIGQCVAHIMCKGGRTTEPIMSFNDVGAFVNRILANYPFSDYEVRQGKKRQGVVYNCQVSNRLTGAFVMNILIEG